MLEHDLSQLLEQKLQQHCMELYDPSPITTTMPFEQVPQVPEGSLAATLDQDRVAELREKYGLSKKSQCSSLGAKYRTGPDSEPLHRGRFAPLLRPSTSSNHAR